MTALWCGLAVWLWLGPSSVRRARRLLVVGNSPARMPLRWVAAGALPILGVVVIGGWTGAALGIVLAPVAVRWISTLESSAQRRHSAVVQSQLPAALDLMVAVLEVGQPPVGAFTVTAQASPEPLATRFHQVAHRLSVVGDERAVWAGLTIDGELASLGRAFALAAETGIPVAQIVRGLADDQRRDRRALRRDAARRIAVSTAAPLGVCFLPAFFVVGIVPTIISSFQAFTW